MIDIVLDAEKFLVLVGVRDGEVVIDGVSDGDCCTHVVDPGAAPKHQSQSLRLVRPGTGLKRSRGQSS